MPIKIPSKNIYNLKNTKIAANKTSKVQIAENSFDSIQSGISFNVNLDYAIKDGGLGLDGFGYSEGYNNIKYIKVESNNYYYVRFWFETELPEEIFLLRNIKAKISTSGIEKNRNDPTIDYPTKNYTSDGSDIWVGTIESSDDFGNQDGTPIGTYGDIGILRIGIKRAKIYVNIAYGFDDGNTQRIYKTANIFIYADKQIQSNYTTGNGTNSGEVFSIESNELINSETIYSETTKISAYIAEKTLEKYKDGIETATVLCSISDYYDEEGTIKISVSGIKKTFSISDKVLLFKRDSSGNDVPISKYLNGKGKVFSVVGIRFFYDGAVWQELKLQEVK